MGGGNNCEFRQISWGLIRGPQFLPVNDTWLNDIREQKGRRGRGSAGEGESRECEAGKAQHKAGGSTKPGAPALSSPVPSAFLSRAFLYLAKQCGPRKNKEINTARQRPAVWIHNLSPRLFVLRSFTYLPQWRPHPFLARWIPSARTFRRTPRELSLKRKFCATFRFLCNKDSDSIIL